MSSFTINSNVTSLLVQRRLSSSTEALQETFTRLSSGLRINNASDDAAGLAISEALNTDARVYAQGVRNVNDAVSVLSVYDGALEALSTIVTRQRELAVQAANGTLSAEQRRSLHEEADALVSEYNRIVESTQFNSQDLMTQKGTRFDIATGYGANGIIPFELANELAQTIGDGTYADPNLFTASNDPERMKTADFNQDGNTDVVFVHSGQNRISVMLGNGDGTFGAATTITLNTPNRIEVNDFNGDGRDDFVVTDSITDDVATVFLGNGDGTFAGPQSFSLGTSPSAVTSGDLNGDGIVDLAITDYSGEYIGLLFGNGDGTFKSQTTAPITSGFNPTDVAMGDLNGDGIVDLVANAPGDMFVLLGQGGGAFGTATQYGLGSIGTARDVHLIDLNGDSVLDYFSLNTTTLSVAIGNGDGTFQTPTIFNTGATNTTQGVLGDINEDGRIDFVALDEGSTSFHTFFGNGDGTFRSVASKAAGIVPRGIILDDLNKDSVLDVAVASRSSGGTLGVFLGNSDFTTRQGLMRLYTADEALAEIPKLEEALSRISLERSAVGAAQSRFETALNNLATAREEYQKAAAQIRDADIAEETAKLVRNQILQQAAASLLGAANQSPQLALRLLST